MLRGQIHTTASELMRKADLSKNHFKKWMKSANSSTYASFVAAQEIVRRGKPLTDGEYLKESFIKISEHLFTDFKNKSESKLKTSVQLLPTQLPVINLKTKVILNK